MNRRHQKGLTLVELLVAMVLGLVVVGGVIGVLLANKSSYNTNNGLAQVQETARTAFELMARDIRQAAGNGCDNPTRTSNNLKVQTGWWQSWWGMAGVNNGDVDTAIATGTADEQRVAGTDTIHVQGLEGAGVPIASHDAGAHEISLNTALPTFGIDDIMLACDFDHATIFQLTDWAGDADSQTLTHDTGAGSVGNCWSGLGYPPPATCDDGSGLNYEYPENALIGRLLAAVWYVGNNDRPAEGGRSLYRRRLGPGGVVITEEIAAGVTNLQVQYGQNDSDDIEDAGTPGLSWPDVNSIFITLTAESADTRVTTDNTVNNGRISRTFTYLITLRNRVP